MTRKKRDRIALDRKKAGRQVPVVPRYKCSPRVCEHATSSVSMSQCARDILSGTLGGLAQIASGHPFDTVKVNLQAQASEARFAGALDCMRQLVAEEGVRGLYKGAAAPVASAVIQNAAIFGAYGGASRFFARCDGFDPSEERLPLGTTARAAAAAGFALAFVESPVELVKCKVQVQVQHGELLVAGAAKAPRAAPSGSLATARAIFRRHGVRGMFQGFGATVLRSTQAKTLYFVSFEWATRTLAPAAAADEVPLIACFMAGGFAGAMAWCAGPVYPTDVIKTRLQLDHSDPARRIYSGFGDCLRQTVQQEGLHALFKGFMPCLARAILVNACIFTAFTAGKRQFNRAKPSEQ